MKLPRVSIGSIMTCLVIVAIDCATLRTLELENIVEMRIGHFSEVVLAILAMSNVIAVLMARMIRDGFWFRPSRFGFVLGGLIGIGATVPGIVPILLWAEESSTIGPLMEQIDDWMGDSRVQELIATYVIVGFLPFLFFQVPVGLACGWAFGRFTVRERTVDLGVRPSLGRRVGSLATLVILVALPAPAIEGLIRWRLEASLARLPAGQVAVVRFLEPDGSPLMVPFPKRSKFPALDGLKVRVVRDDRAMEVEIYQYPDKEIRVDDRPVEVTILDGDQPRETILMNRRYLRPVR